MLCPCSALCAVRAVVIDMLKEKETFKRSEVIEAAQQRVRGVKGASNGPAQMNTACAGSAMLSYFFVLP